MGTLTVRENLNFSASLRLSHALSKKERGQRVEGVIRDLGLTEVADSKVGTEFIRGISGGERKRTNIGMELITSPQVLFLDEPTTGLDSSTARTVIQLLHRLGYMEVIESLSHPTPHICVLPSVVPLLFSEMGMQCGFFGLTWMYSTCINIVR